LILVVTRPAGRTLTARSKVVLLSSVISFVTHMSPAATGVFREQVVPGAPGGASQVVGSGYYAYWFTEFDTNRIGMLTRDGQFQEFIVPTPDSGPHGIALNWRDGAIWFTELKAGKIGRLTRDGTFSEFPIPTPQSAPWGIVCLDDIWFTESAANKLGRVNADGSITEFSIPSANANPRGISDSTYHVPCFAEFAADRIGCLENGKVVERVLAPGSGPSTVCMDRDVSLWFIEETGNRVGSVNFNGVRSLTETRLQEFSIPTPASGPADIVADSWGGIWFSEKNAGQVGYVSGGRVTEYPLPDRSSQPTGISLSVFGAEVLESRTNRFLEVQQDAVIVAGAGTSGSWTTRLDVANPVDRPGFVFAGVYPKPSTISLEGQPPQAGTTLAPNGSGQISLDRSVVEGLYNFFVSGPEVGTLPSVRARILYGNSPTQSADLPTIRLSTLTSLNPTMLVFPGALRKGPARSNLLISELSPEDGDFAPHPLVVPVRIDLLDADGNPIGSENAEIMAGRTLYLVDIVGRLGVSTLSLGQVRVTKLGDQGLLWGYLATVNLDGAVSISSGVNP
jgi:virginiamycin B lyase